MAGVVGDGQIWTRARAEWLKASEAEAGKPEGTGGPRRPKKCAVQQGRSGFE